MAADVHWRAITLDDVAALTATRNACERADRIPMVTPDFDVRLELEDPSLDLARDTFVAIGADGTVAAWGETVTHAESTREGHFAYLAGYVHPDCRGQGIGGMLLDRLVARGREQLAEKARGEPRLLRHPAFEWQYDTLALLKSRGFTPLRYFQELQRDLREPLPIPELPAGAAFAPWTEQRNAELHALHEEAFADHWGHTPGSTQMWDSGTYANPRFRDDLSVVVTDAAATAVALLLTQVYPEDWEATGRREAWIAQIAVAPAWRQKGIGAALLTEAMYRVRADGLDYATLAVDSASPTGANRLYERLGFTPSSMSITFALAA